MLLKNLLKLKLITLSAALPAALVAISPFINSERRVAAVAVPNFQNWGILNTVGDSHIHAVDAWKLEEGNRDIVVAVVDTGIDANHPDIKPNLWRGKDKDGKEIYGWDFVTNTPNPKDDHGHGTHVAGILGAALNAKSGISGVAHKVSLMAVKYYSAQNSGAKNLENSVKALDWAIEHGARIINYSGGGPEPSAAELAVLKKAKEKNVLIVAAAGNERSDIDQSGNYYYPCAYRLENIVCVAATNINNGMLPASNWGKARVDVAAPGEGIMSTVPGGKYMKMSGTSQATAFVSGLAVLMLSKNKELKPAEVSEIVRNTADKLPILKDKVISGGKVNAYKALAALNQMKRPTTPVFIANGMVNVNEAVQASLRKVSSKKFPLKPASTSVKPKVAVAAAPKKAYVKSSKKASNGKPAVVKQVSASQELQAELLKLKNKPNPKSIM